MFGKLLTSVEWTLSGTGSASKDICHTRDIFEARLDSFFISITKKNILLTNEVALLTACLGEIGNNTFDHNLGQWRDIPGCLFDYEIKTKHIFIWITDRGSGILSTLKRVQNDLYNDEEALHIAFEKKISGRAPEKRGNGLKFVRSVINRDQRKGLFCQSGSGTIYFGGDNLQDIQPILELQKVKVPGVFVLIRWGFS